MVYTVTFNPSLDYIVSVEGFQLGKTNRTAKEQMLPGGKGINVSTVLKNLGIPNIALGFSAGFTGEEIKRRVEEMGLASDFINLQNGYSRINVKMKDFDGTEINGQGPAIPERAVEELYGKLDALQAGDYLVLAGSIPDCLPSDMYERILERLEGRGIHYIVDATKDLLLNVLKYHPFLIKPNSLEFEQAFKQQIKAGKGPIEIARQVVNDGIPYLCISMGADGAILVDKEHTYRAKALPIRHGRRSRFRPPGGHSARRRR